MAFMLLIFLRLFFLLVTQSEPENAEIPVSFPFPNITLGSLLTPDTNPSWVSPSGLFAFGFYEQDDGYAVGIWLASEPEITVVWTANRDDPPVSVSSNSSIELTRDGWLLLHTSTEDKNITSNQSSQATLASMLDSGNFVLYDESSSVIWESFAYPCDTILGGQKLASEDNLVSSISTSQHMSGNFFLSMQTDGNLVAYSLIRTSDRVYWTSGTFSTNYESLNLSRSGSLSLVGFGLTQKVLNPTTSSQSKKNQVVIFRATLNSDGNFVLYSHIFTSPSSSNLTTMMKMNIEWQALQDPCDAKGICGFNSYCSSTTAGNFQCHCFPGFLFLNGTRNVKSYGCFRNFTDEEACNRKGPALSYNITVFDNMNLLAHYAYSVTNLRKDGCGKSCLDDCNCWASLYVDGSCKKLKVPIIYAVLSKSMLTTVFIKTSFPYNEVKEPHQLPGSTNLDVVVAERKKLVLILAITLGCLALMCTVMAVSAFFFYRVHAHRYQAISSENVDSGFYKDHFALRAFSFDELQKATDGFKEVIGRNSYGQVYKGFISEGKKAVAVKRLERMFEGEGRFRAEITAIAQTHHRNLVRLLGFCIKGATKLLVYEFMSNGSLEDVLFNTETPPGRWKERVRVPLDVARGILYLHEECEARIIHCNIKPQNILFDESWTAKISDFGLSKLLRSNQSGTLLTVSGDHDRGTRGYLAPEWHKNTLISTKVDIYSFGVVLLEILCCRKDMEIDVLSTWVYNCFVDKDWNRLTGDHEEVDVNMLEKMVKVALLCIQDDPDARPSIKNVILMLEGTADIPNPPSPSPPPLI